MIKELLPPSVAKESINKLAEATEVVWQNLFNNTSLAIIYNRINELPEVVLDLLAWQFHIEGYELAQNVEEKRQMIKNAVELHRYKGTPYAVKKVLETLRINGQVKEWFEYGGQPYRFRVSVSDVKQQDVWQKLPLLITQYKNVRSHLEAIDYQTEASGSMYIGSVVPHGYYVQLYPHVAPSVQTSNYYFGDGFYYAYSFSVPVNQPEVNIPASNHYAGGFISMASYMEVRNG